MQEILYQRITLTQQRDATVRHELYLVKNLTVQKMTDTLSLLLESDSDTAEEVVIIPCEDRNMAILKHAYRSLSPSTYQLIYVFCSDLGQW